MLNRRHFCQNAIGLTWATSQTSHFAFGQTAGPNPGLSLWNEGPAKKAILDFVSRVTTEGSQDYVSPTNRIAVFDNDGTLWNEQPMYIQLAFALDRVKAMAATQPEWKNAEPFRSALAGDMKALAATGEKGLVELLMATHTGNTPEQFARIVEEWLSTAKHPRFQQPYTACVYIPMVQLLAFLRKNQFKTFIVSGGGVEFVRVFSERVYGVPPHQVVGTTIKTRYEERQGIPTLVRLPEIDFIDDKAGKPVAIQKFIGRRPTMAFGNSDGDFEMLAWTMAGTGPRFGMLLHHTDPKREYAYDCASAFGKLDKALEEAPKRGWVLAQTGTDFRKVFAFDSQS